MMTRGQSRRFGWLGLCVGLGSFSPALWAQPAAPETQPTAAPKTAATTPPPAATATAPPAPTAQAQPAPLAPTAAAPRSVRPAVDCRHTDGCRQAGLCTAHAGRCVASTDAECAWSIGCRTHGICRAANGQCTYDRCRSSEDCRDKGRCVGGEKGKCVAGSPDDCRVSRGCTEDGDCYWSRDRKACTDGTRRRSTGALIGGAISLGIGGLALLGGSALMITAETYECDGFICVYDQQDLDTFRYAGIAMLIVGGAAASVGIPLLIYGAPKETDESTVQSMSAWRPELRIGPTGGSLRWNF